MSLISVHPIAAEVPAATLSRIEGRWPGDDRSAKER